MEWGEGERGPEGETCSSLSRGGDAQDREPRGLERDERGRGKFMVVSELVLDQWGFKAYKSATASVGFVLSSILSARAAVRAAIHSRERIPPVPRHENARRSFLSCLRSRRLLNYARRLVDEGRARQ